MFPLVLGTPRKYPMLRRHGKKRKREFEQSVEAEDTTRDRPKLV
jgi:hypothetical protein